MDFTKKTIINIISALAPDLDHKNIERLIDLGTYVKKEDKEFVLDRINKNQNIFFILEGTVRGYVVCENGNEKTIFLRTEGFFGGDIRNIFYNEESRYYFESIGQTHVFILNFNDLENFALSNRVFMQMYADILKEIINVLNYRIETMITMSAKERYRNLIKSNPKFLGKVYNKHIANFLGITPVSLSRIIKEINIEKENKLLSTKVGSKN